MGKKQNKTMVLIWITVSLLFFILIFFLFQKYQNHRIQYTSGHEILNSTSALEKNTHYKFRENLLKVKELENHFLRNRLYTTEQDSILLKSAQQIISHSAEIETAGAAKISSILYEENFHSPHLAILSYEFPGADKHGSQFFKALNKFLNLMAEYNRNANTKNRIEQLKNLTGTNEAVFYKGIYHNKPAYLVLADLAILKSLVVTIAADYLSQVRVKLLNRIDKYGSATNKLHWMPVRQEKPLVVIAGDSLNFEFGIVSIVNIPHSIEHEFIVQEATIDKIYANSIAYISVPVINTGKFSKRHFQRQIPFKIKLLLPNFRDTIFTDTIKFSQFSN